MFVHLTESVSTMADEIVFTFQCLGIRWCVCARPAVLDLQSLSVLAVRSEEMSVVVFAGTGVRVCCRVCTRAGEWEGMKVRFWTETFDVKEQRLQSVCQLPALYHHPNTWPLQKKKKKKCACWCARVRMALRACICVSGLITQRLGFVTLGYCEHSCAHPVMCYMGWQRKRGRARRHIRTSAEPLSPFLPFTPTIFGWVLNMASQVHLREIVNWCLCNFMHMYVNIFVSKNTLKRASPVATALHMLIMFLYLLYKYT